MDSPGCVGCLSSRQDQPPTALTTLAPKSLTIDWLKSISCPDFEIDSKMAKVKTLAPSRIFVDKNFLSTNLILLIS
jgi:hypothetical protein